MARKYLLLFPVVLVVSLIAIVRAQDNAWRPPNRSTQEPAILRVNGEESELSGTNSVLRKPQRTAGLADRMQSMRRSDKPTTRLEDSADISGGELSAEPAPVVDPAEPGAMPSVLKRKTKSLTERSIESQPAPLATRPGGSSRRTLSPSKSSPDVPPTEIEAPSREPIHVRTRPPADDTLLASVGPTIQVTTTGPKATVLNKATPYVVTLSNLGDTTAHDVHVRIALPKWVEIASSEATAGAARRQDDGAGTERFVWVVNQLEPRTQLQLSLQLVAKESRPIDMNIDWIFRPVAAAASIEVHQPQMEMTLSGPKDALFNETLTYILTVANPGNGDAENVQVKLATGQNAAEMINVGLLPAGQQKQIEVQLTANQAGSMTIRAEGAADGELRAEVAAELLVRRAQLQVVVTGPETSFAGTEVIYQLRVANSGNATAEEISAALALPPGTKLLAATDGGKPTANNLQWKVGTLAAGAERLFEVRCELATAGDNRIEARAQAAGNLTATHAVVTEVQASVELNLVLNEPKGPRAVGEVVVYEIQIANRGTKVAEDVHVVVQFSDGIEPLSADGAKSELLSGQVVFQPLPRIAAGETTVLKVKARAERDGSHIVRTEIKCGDIQDSIQKTKKFYSPTASGTATPDGSATKPATTGRR